MPARKFRDDQVLLEMEERTTEKPFVTALLFRISGEKVPALTSSALSQVLTGRGYSNAAVFGFICEAMARRDSRLEFETDACPSQLSLMGSSI